MQKMHCLWVCNAEQGRSIFANHPLAPMLATVNIPPCKWPMTVQNSNCRGAVCHYTAPYVGSKGYKKRSITVLIMVMVLLGGGGGAV